MSPGKERTPYTPRKARFYCDYALESSPLPIVAVEGLTHIVRYVNSAFSQLSGTSKESLIGGPFAEVVPEREDNGCIALLDRVYRTGVAETLTDQHHRTAPICDKTERDALWSYTAWAVPYDRSHRAGVMMQVADTTETARFRSNVTSLNERLTLSAVHQHELAELAEVSTQRLRQAMRETNHRVKNNLQTVSALMDMRAMARDGVVSEEELRQLQIQVKTLAAIHDILTRDVTENPTHSRLSSQEALRTLVPMLEGLIGNARIAWSADEFDLPIKQGVAVALVINELVCNAVKHGGLQVNVIFKASGDRALLEVCDDGPGFAMGFNSRSAAHYGLELVDTVCRLDLGGTVTFSNRDEGGARVSVTFQLSH